QLMKPTGARSPGNVVYRGVSGWNSCNVMAFRTVHGNSIRKHATHASAAARKPRANWPRKNIIHKTTGRHATSSNGDSGRNNVANPTKIPAENAFFRNSERCRSRPHVSSPAVACSGFTMATNVVRASVVQNMVKVSVSGTAV